MVSVVSHIRNNVLNVNFGYSVGSNIQCTGI